MAPLKFEEELKEKLEGREIKPSINAWDRISKELDEPQPKRKSFWGYGIAASVIGLLILSVWFFNADSEDDDQEIINIDNKEEIKTEEKELLFELPKESIVNVESIEKSVPEEKENQPQKRNERPSKVENRLPKTSTVVAEIETKKEQKSIISDPLIEDKFIEKQLNTVLESVALLETESTKIIEGEIDSLLHNAQREILIERAAKAGISIDAMALLAEAEGELDKTFRDKVFEKLKVGFQKVRTAVAGRNN